MLMKLTPGLAVLFDDGDAGDVGAAALVQVEVLQLERDCSRQEEGVLLRLAQPLLLHVDVGYFRLFRHFLRTTEKFQFHQHFTQRFFRRYPFAKKSQSRTVIRKKFLYLLL